MLDKDYFYHYGVKGQKWGVRKKSQPAPSTTDKAKKMSDADLKAAVKRLNLEKDYIRLTKEANDRDKGTVAKGFDAVAGILQNAGKNVITTVVTRELMKVVLSAVDSKTT